MARPKPVVLTILDGWGHSDSPENNAITAASTPTWDMLMNTYPHGLLNASEMHVGLPDGQMGNSEVGHMHIGSGRTVMQDLPRIDAAIKDGSLAKNPALLKLIKKLTRKKLFKSGQGTCHLMGLVSPGGVHSHQRHIVALARVMAQAGVSVWIHAFTDGRDTPPKSAAEYLTQLEQDITDLPGVQVATVSGRYYAMDRDKRWERTQKAYEMLTEARGKRAASVQEAVQQSYAEGKTDEFIEPVAIGEYRGMENHDAIIMANFRADRVRQILQPFTLESGGGDFEPSYIPRLTGIVGMTEYSEELNPFMDVAFAVEAPREVLGEVVAQQGLKQLRIAETEKYAHVTFFFNGGREEAFKGEDRILVPSPKVATYDLQPEMSAPEVTDKLIEAIAGNQYDLIVVNYANTDMVGHTGDINAAIKAVEAVDTCLGRLTEAVLGAGGAMLITADHGNAEQMYDHHSNQSHTAHTLNLVPVVLVSEALKGKKVPIKTGALSDVAPTILALMGLPQPKAMTGQSLLASHA